MEKYTVLSAKVGDTETGAIAGIAVKYGVNIERGMGLYERVEKGAFKAQLSAPNRIPVLWQHDHDSPIGRAVSLKDVGDELAFKAQLSESSDIPDARKALALLREGIIDEISIGFEWGSWHEEREDEKLTIVHTKSRLREFSIVTFGALGKHATVKSVASAGLSVAAYRLRLAGLNA